MYLEVGTYYVNPSQWNPKVSVIELSPRILTYLRSPAFEGGDYKALFARWAEAIASTGAPVKVNVHGPYGRMSKFTLKKWEKILSALDPLVNAVRDVKGEIAITFYDRFKTHEDVRILAKVAEILEGKGVKVALRPTVWYMPSNLKHRILTSVDTTIDFAKMYGLGVNLDPENIFTRFVTRSESKEEALEKTAQAIRDAAKVNKENSVPQFGRFAPFKVLRAGAKLGETTVRMKALKVLLPWSKREESVVPVEKQLYMLLTAAERVHEDVYAVYNSTKDREDVRERVVLYEVKKLLPKAIASSLP